MILANETPDREEIFHPRMMALWVAGAGRCEDRFVYPFEGDPRWEVSFERLRAMNDDEFIACIEEMRLTMRTVWEEVTEKLAAHKAMTT